MADNSKIEWTDASWNPIRARNKVTGKVGWHCEHATTGCVNCYAEKLNLRLGTGLPFKPGHRSDIHLFLDDKMLVQPLKWKRPRMIFVCSMTDLFADFVPDEMIDRLFAVMALCPQHTFQVLTKRSARMRGYVSTKGRSGMIAHEAAKLNLSGSFAAAFTWDVVDAAVRLVLPNVWLGVSAERQQEAEARIPDLLTTPAAVRFVSLEPLLGPISLLLEPNESTVVNALTGGIKRLDENYQERGSHLDLVIVGGESQNGARPMHPDWAASLRDQCAATRVPFFFKQWGEWAPLQATFPDPHGGPTVPLDKKCETRLVAPDGKNISDRDVGTCDFPDASRFVYRLGKKANGRLLDGREHNGMPVVARRAPEPAEA